MLERHKLYKHSFKPPCNYMCAHCDKRFPKQFRLKVHEFYKHGIEHPDIKVSIVFLLLFFFIPTLFRKNVGDIVIASVHLSVHPSVRLSIRYVISSQTAGQNPTKFGEWLAYTSGECKSTFIFGPAPRGPGEGSKGQILTISNFKVNFKDFYAKMCT